MGNELVVRDPTQYALWVRRIAECKNSGKAVTKWCAENGIGIKAYYYWHNKILKAGGTFDDVMPASFYEISPCVTGGSGIVATLHCDAASMDVYSGADAETLATIWKVLKSC